MKTIISQALGVCIAALFVLSFFASYHFAYAFSWNGPDVDLKGWAWSSNIGWISMHCSTGGDTGGSVCSSSNYGVTMDNTDGSLDGYAWSSNIGWIEFGGLSGCPSGTCNARLEEFGQDLELVGWARALSYGDGWDGWVSLSCRNGGSCSTSNYKIEVPQTGTRIDSLNKWAWGSFVVGWVDFSGVTFTPPCTGGLISLSCVGDDIVEVREDAWCRENKTTTNCPNGCDDTVDPPVCIGLPDPNVSKFNPLQTVVRVGDTIDVEIEVTNTGSCVVIYVDGEQTVGSRNQSAPILPNGPNSINTVWTSEPLTGRTKFELACTPAGGGPEVIDAHNFTVEVIPISTEI